MKSESDEESSETESGKDKTPLTMVVPAGVLLAGALAFALWPHIGTLLERGALQFEDQHQYAATVLHGSAATKWHAIAKSEPTSFTPGAILTSLGTALGAMIVALASLYRRRLPLLAGYRPMPSVRRAAEALQSGLVTDYVAWLVLGVACLGGALAFSLR